MRSVAAALSQEQLDVARTFISYAGCLAEAIGGERPAAARAVRRLGEQGTRSLLESKGGLIVGTAHFGAWDAAAPLLARDFGRPVVVAMQAEADAAARAIHDSVRARAGVRVVHVGSHPLDALASAAPPARRRHRGRAAGPRRARGAQLERAVLGPDARDARGAVFCWPRWLRCRWWPSSSGEPAILDYELSEPGAPCRCPSALPRRICGRRLAASRRRWSARSGRAPPSGSTSAETDGAPRRGLAIRSTPCGSTLAPTRCAVISQPTPAASTCSRSAPNAGVCPASRASPR